MNKVENDPLLSILYFPTAGRCIFNFFKKIPLREKQNLSFVYYNTQLRQLVSYFNILDSLHKI